MVLVARTQLAVGLLREIVDILTEQRVLAAVQDKAEITPVCLHVAVEGIRQLQRIFNPDIVRVPGEGTFQAGAAGLDLPEPQLVHSEQTMTPPRLRIELHGLLRKFFGFPVESALRRYLRKRGVKIGVVRIQCHDLLFDARELLRVAFKKADHAEHGQGLERYRVDLECELRLLPGVAVLLQLDKQLRHEYPCGHLVRIDEQRLQCGLHRLRRIIEVLAARQTKQRARVSVVDLKHFHEQRRCLPVIVFFQQQFTECYARVHVGGVLTARLVV